MQRASRLSALLACALIAFWAGSGQAAGDARFGRYHALVIGNNGYAELTPLKTAVNDATVVADLLERRYGFSVTLLLDATRYDIVAALSGLRRTLTPNDNLLVYYAGHGVLDEITGTGYWLPVDAEANNSANWIANGTITDQVKGMAARHVLVVADSCYSGSLSRGIEAKIGQGADPDEWLQRMASQRSRTVLASGGLEPVQDTGGDGHSVFARQLIEALRENREIVDGQRLYDRIKHKVVVNADQTPRYDNIHKAGHDGGDFLFVPITINVTAEPPADSPGAPTGGDRELAFWNSIKDEEDAGAFEAYLEAFPNGTFAALARYKVGKLRDDGPPGAVTPEQARPADEPGDAPDEVGVFGVAEMDRIFVASRNANVRALPSTASARMTTLAAGTEVTVTGDVADADWYRIELPDGGRGYVFAALLEEPGAAPPTVAPTEPRPLAPGEEPRYAGPKVVWGMQTMFPRDFAQLGDLAHRLADGLDDLSGNEFQLNVFGAGEVVHPAKLLEEVATGAIDAGFSIPYYWAGRDPGFMLIASAPFEPGAGAHAEWLMSGPGRGPMDALYGAFGVHGLPCGAIVDRGDLWLNRRIASREDLRGVKLRVSGLVEQVLTRLDARVVMLPGSEIVPALSRGAIDGVRFLNPAIDRSMGIPDAARYYYRGFVEPFTLLDLIVNARAWDALSEEGRALVEFVCLNNVHHAVTRFGPPNEAALDELEGTVTVLQWPRAVRAALRDAWRGVATDLARASPHFKALHDALPGQR